MLSSSEAHYYHHFHHYGCSSLGAELFWLEEERQVFNWILFTLLPISLGAKHLPTGTDWKPRQARNRLHCSLTQSSLFAWTHLIFPSNFFILLYGGQFAQMFIELLHVHCFNACPFCSFAVAQLLLARFCLLPPGTQLFLLRPIRAQFFPLSFSLWPPKTSRNEKQAEFLR